MTRATRYLMLALFAAYPAVVVVLATQGGIALSPDSVTYLSTAVSVSSGQGLVSFDGQPLTLFPPGLPLILGSVGAFGASISTVAIVLNVLSVTIAVIGTYALGVIVSGSWRVALVAAGVVSVSASFTEVFVWLWTEPLFTAVTLAVIVVFAWAVRHSRVPWWVIGCAGALTSVAFGLRYVGLVMIPVLVLGVWWASRALPRRSRVIRLISSVVIGLVVPILVVARNVYLGAGPFGDRSGGVRTLQDALMQSVRVLGEYVVPPESSSVAVLAGFVIAVLVFIALWAAAMDRDPVVLLVGTYVLMYLATNIWSQSSTRLDSPSARLLAPVVPAIAVLAVLGTRIAVNRISNDVVNFSAHSPNTFVHRSSGRPVIIMMWVAIAVAVGLLIVASIRADQRLIDSGQVGELGIGSANASSDLIEASTGLMDGQGFASNDPWLVHLELGTVPVVRMPPSPAEWPIDRVARDREVLVDAVRSGSVTHALVLSSGAATDTWENLAQVGLVALPVKEITDGGLYRLEFTEN